MTATSPAPSTSALILSSALDLFSDIGYEAASMRQIAAAVGVKPASLYNHYASKQDILWEIVTWAMGELTRGQAEVHEAHPDPVGRLEAFVRMHAGFHAREHRAAVVVNRQLASLSPSRFDEIRGHRDRYERGLRSTLQTGIEQGVFTAPDVRLTSYAILAMGMNVAVWYRPGGPSSVEAICDVQAVLALRMAGAG